MTSVGRQLRPTTPAISEAPPSEFDLECSERLQRFMAKASPQESIEEQQKRMQILTTLASIFEEWVHSVCLYKGLSKEVADQAGGQVFTSGSYRLGVNEKGMDIDTICVAPRMVTREDFFDSLKVILEDHESVTNLSSIETAMVCAARWSVACTTRKEPPGGGARQQATAPSVPPRPASPAAAGSDSRFPSSPSISTM